MSGMNDDSRSSTLTTESIDTTTEERDAEDCLISFDPLVHPHLDSLMTTQVHDFGSQRHSIICSLLKSAEVSARSTARRTTYGCFEFQYC
jgi:hypothetical protein